MTQATSLGALAVSIAILISCSASKEATLCNGWVISSVSVSDRAEFDKWMRAALTQQGMTPDAVEAFMEQAPDPTQEFKKELDEGRGVQLVFKDDHSFSQSLSGGTQTQSSSGAGTWVLSGSMLTMTAAPPGQAGRSDTLEVLSLSKSQLVVRGHGVTTTYISSK